MAGGSVDNGIRHTYRATWSETTNVPRVLTEVGFTIGSTLSPWTGKTHPARMDPDGALANSD